MLILALDTASPLCAAALAEDGRILARADDALGKGHSEHLIRHLPALLAEAGRQFSDLDRIGVNIGPGSFTGVRVGVAAARALALALGRPAIGISAFAALKAQAEAEAAEGGAAKKAKAGLSICAALPAPREQAYWQYFPGPAAAEPPQAGPAANLPGRLAAMRAAAEKTGHRFCLIGPQAAELAAQMPHSAADNMLIIKSGLTADIAFFAALAAAAKAPAAPPAPLYMRPPDAKPQSAQPNAAAMKRQFRAAPKTEQQAEPEAAPAAKMDAPQ